MAIIWQGVGKGWNQIRLMRRRLISEKDTRTVTGVKNKVYNTQMGHHALDDERQQVNQQAMKTPGRRGEIIKNEEIDKEFSKRYFEHKKRKVVY